MFIFFPNKNLIIYCYFVNALWFNILIKYSFIYFCSVSAAYTKLSKKGMLNYGAAVYLPPFIWTTLLIVLYYATLYNKEIKNVSGYSTHMYTLIGLTYSVPYYSHLYQYAWCFRQAKKNIGHMLWQDITCN